MSSGNNATTINLTDKAATKIKAAGLRVVELSQGNNFLFFDMTSLAIEQFQSVLAANPTDLETIRELTKALALVGRAQNTFSRRFRIKWESSLIRSP
jgi:hypothetical protein